MPVITLSRLTGSGGGAIGRAVAEQLGAVFLDRQIIAEVARRLGIPEEHAADLDERADTFTDRLARTLAVVTPSLALMGSPLVSTEAETTPHLYVEMTRQIIRDVAGTGNAVIFGHGAQYVLSDWTGALHVQCVAPLAYRVQRMMRLRGLTESDAERWVRHEDDRRADFVRQYYNADWRDPTCFHLILNTARWSEEDCASLILAAAGRLPAPTMPAQ